jgi:hypothetical protein
MYELYGSGVCEGFPIVADKVYKEGDEVNPYLLPKAGDSLALNSKRANGMYSNAPIIVENPIDDVNIIELKFRIVTGDHSALNGDYYYGTGRAIMAAGRSPT